MVWGLLERGKGQRGLRGRGVIDVLETAGLLVDYIEISPEIDQDPVRGLSTIKEYVDSNPDVRFIIADHGGLTSKLAAFLRTIEKKPGEIIGAGFDLSEGVVLGIEDGYIGVVQDHAPDLRAVFLR